MHGMAECKQGSAAGRCGWGIDEMSAGAADSDESVNSELTKEGEDSRGFLRENLCIYEYPFSI
jgi:hypothetical protein